MKSHPPDHHHPTHGHAQFPINHPREPGVLPKLIRHNQLHPPDHEPDLHRPPFEPDHVLAPTEHPELLKLPVVHSDPNNAPPTPPPDVVQVLHEEVRPGLDQTRPFAKLQISPTPHPEHAINQPGPNPFDFQHLGHLFTP